MLNLGSVYLFSLVSSLCLLFGLNFLLRKGNLVVAKILAIQFLLMAYVCVAAYYLMPENIVETPYFFRTLAPIYYILPPLNFLFLWYLLHPRAKFNWKHLLFFIPFLLQTIENLPFYLSSRAVKLEEVKWMLAQGDFFAYSPEFMWFDPIIHIYAKVVLYAVFYIAMLYYYLRFRREAQNQILFQNLGFHFWIIGILVFRFCTLFYIWYNFIFIDYGKVSFITTDYLLIAEFVFHLVYLALNPKFLDVKILTENLRGPEKPEAVLTNEEEVRMNAMAEKVESYFRSTEVFLNSKLTAELLGALTGIPHRQISQAIKYKFGLSFRDYLNQYRMDYVDKLLNDPAFLTNSSIEVIAETAGFGSRQSFYTVFKKAKGCTPKEYFNTKLG
jgi:AraC-like DNA-binding protein